MTLPKRNIAILTALGAIAAITGGIILARNPDLIRQALSIVDVISAWCTTHPAFLFLAIVLLPGFGFPASPLIVLAGVVWGSTWQTCAITIAAVALNMAWTHFLAAGPARAIVIRLLGERWQRWKNIHPDNLRRLTILFRITPGIPFFIQNYVLGLLGVPFLTYISISVPLNGIFVIGFVLTGGAIFEGDLGMVAAGISILIAAALGLGFLRSKLKASRKIQSTT
ncbi:VTT domain-containing protein [Akkermansiaceae bacterium]|nr:VTT domain-containing protein [Akkermansiaceae bacterium]